jgi:hypothetical protein
MGNDFQKLCVVSWNRSHSFWMVCIRSCQDEIISMKIVVHKIFSEELMILSAVAFKNFKSPVPELNDLFIFPSKIPDPKIPFLRSLFQSKY